ncbi:MAG: UvrD-helicase domain-containing protein, partial [Muribaculaceae bacterium]|nr:UvrD-helicase domain-containing protein [Muribaculaceae bacterium]
IISTIDLLLKHINSFGVFDAVCRNISRIKADANTILLSDTNALLRRIIGDDTAPFLYERTGMRLRHFLIDEFQDTSRLQWQNLKPLVAESLSHNNDNLIIGDVKQCIY